ncbi:MAG: hypothetical protein ACO3SO_01890, partial [Luteolibacter sp.]
MAISIATVFKSVSEGGVFMLPFMLLFALWLWALISEFTRKPFCSHPLACMLFPIGFLILGMLRIALSWYEISTTMLSAGSMDPGQAGSDGLVAARALFVIGGAAALSLISAV